MFEGSWNCGRQCLRTRIDEAVKRESASGHSAVRQVRHRIPLGLLLLQAGVLSADELQTVLAAQREAGRGRLGEWLQRILGIQEITVTRILARQWTCSVFEIDTTEQRSSDVLWAPQELLRAAGAVPAGTSRSGALQLGFVDQIDSSLIVAIERMSGHRLDRGIVSPADYSRAIESLFKHPAVQCISREVTDTEDLVRALTDETYRSQPLASRLVRVHDMYWLRMWLDQDSLTSGRGQLPLDPAGVLDLVVRLRPS